MEEGFALPEEDADLNPEQADASKIPEAGKEVDVEAEKMLEESAKVHDLEKDVVSSDEDAIPQRRETDSQLKFEKMSARSGSERNELTHDSKGPQQHVVGFAFTVGPINPVIAPVFLTDSDVAFGDPRNERKVEPLTLAERWRKIQRYREKRKSRRWAKKLEYAGRHHTAERRIRIKGRFVTPAQALANMGASYDSLRTLLASGIADSIEKSLHIVSAQTLFGDHLYASNVTCVSSGQKMEVVDSGQSAVLVEVPQPVDVPVFSVRRVRMREVPPEHTKHHNKLTKTLLA
ncbi:MAG: CCT domain-containing protein [Candidatus Pacebacteria bacterium]|nr:CCT domain-containing protein [Candidatus Paceibacterota bacterium]